MYEKDQKIQTLSHLQVVSKISNLTEKLSISLNPFRTTIGQAKAPKNIIAELRTSLGEIGLLKQELQTLITTEPFSLKKDTLATYLKDYSSGIYEDKSEEILT